MKHVIKAFAFSLLMLILGGLYALCDTTDDEFYKSSWAIKSYAWLFEHSINPIYAVSEFLISSVTGIIYKLSHIEGLSWTSSTALNSFLYFSLFFLLGYLISRHENRLLNIAVGATLIAMTVVGISLFAIDASIPFTEWTLQIDHPDKSGWATRFPDRDSCERALKALRAGSSTPPFWERPGPHDKAQCFSPEDYGRH